MELKKGDGVERTPLLVLPGAGVGAVVVGRAERVAPVVADSAVAGAGARVTSACMRPRGGNRAKS